MSENKGIIPRWKLKRQNKPKTPKVGAAAWNPWRYDGTAPWEREYVHWTEVPSMLMHSLGIVTNERTVERWIHEGRRHRGFVYKLRTTKVLGKVFVRMADLKAFIEAQTARSDVDKRLLKQYQESRRQLKLLAHQKAPEPEKGEPNADQVQQP